MMNIQFCCFIKFFKTIKNLELKCMGMKALYLTTSLKCNRFKTIISKEVQVLKANVQR